MRCAVPLSLVAALALCACATRDPAAAPPSDGMAWRLTPAADGDEAKLAYGVPDTDDVVLMLACRPGSGAVQVTATAPTAPARLTLRSGSAVSSLPIQSEPAEIQSGVLVEAATTVADPALAAFARTGALSFDLGGRATALAAAPDQARRFVATCAG